jgi:biotin operon repressor
MTLPDPENPGWVDLISVHDAEHLRAKAEWRQTLAQSHPDAGGSDLRFRITQKAREKWLKAETEWYAKRGLTLPEVDRLISQPKPTRNFLECARGKVGRTWRTIAAYQASHPDASDQQIADALGMRIRRVQVNRSRAKASGHPSWVRETGVVRLAALLSDGRPHSVSECRDVVGSGHHFAVAVARLRERGFDIESTYRGKGAFLYRLVGVPLNVTEGRHA